MSQIEQLTKQCCGCGETKALTEFFKRNTDGRLGHKSRCKVCTSNAAREWENNNREQVRVTNKKAVKKHRRHRLSMSYWKRCGLDFDEDDFHNMWAEQGKKCALCGTPKTLYHKKRFPLDHDHATGEVRAILCHRCNMLVGVVESEPALVQKALQYIAKHKNAYQRRVKNA